MSFEAEWTSMPESTQKMFIALRLQAKRAGVSMPEVAADGQMKLSPPSICLHGRPSVVTRQVAEVAAGAGLYAVNDDLVLINSRTGVKKGMTPAIFRPWIDNPCILYKKKAGEGEDARPVPCWLPVDMAASMLASPDCHAKIPRVTRINVVRLPVLRKPAKEGDPPWIELLPEGYDVESQTYTVRGLDYPEDLNLADTFHWARELMQHFDWALTEKKLKRGPMEFSAAVSRSFSARH